MRLAGESKVSVYETKGDGHRCMLGRVEYSYLSNMYVQLHRVGRYRSLHSVRSYAFYFILEQPT